MYIKRHAETVVARLSKMFGAVLVTGPRQVGKTTMLANMLGGINYVSLDDAIQRTSAVLQSNTFLKDNPPPLFIDEVQKAPELFPYIKLSLDASGEKGQFYLSGSQQFQMMKNVSESLSGRLGILVLLGLSMRERAGLDYEKPFVPTDDYLNERRTAPLPYSYLDVWNMIWRGSMPELAANPEFDWQLYYGSYVTTYVERDVKDLAQVGDEVKFTRFMAVLAARTGQLLNLQSVANEVGISQPTADRWLSILIASHLVYLLQPYSTNLTNRAIKTPKLYFLDTGLAAYLSRWNTADALRTGAMSGAYFETFVISEILKSYYNQGIREPKLFFYRDKEKKEIDLIIEEGNTLYPLEIKQHADPTVNDIRNFSVLSRIDNMTVGPGGVICAYDKVVTLRDAFKTIPITII